MKRGVAVVIWFVLSSACGNPGGTDTGNALDVALQAVSSDPSGMLIGADAQGTAFTLESALTYVRHLEFDLPEGTTCADFDDLTAPVYCEEEDGDDGFRISGPYLVDLLTGTSTPLLRDLTIPPATYTRVDVRLDEGETDEGLILPGHPLDGYSVVADGTFTYMGQPRTFDFALAFDDDARFEDIAGTQARRILLALDIATWFETLPITQCLDDGDLTLVGDHLTIADGLNNCANIESAMVDAIRGSGSLEEDDDES